jgi:antitoxin (DNA-binding transcriptional repressor) of toxin-antitoxin stability system
MRQMHVAEVKRQLREALNAAERGASTVVLRHGKPVAVIGPVKQDPRPDLPKPRKPGGLLALAGLLSDWETMEEDMAEIIAERQNDLGRPLPPAFIELLEFEEPPG